MKRLVAPIALVLVMIAPVLRADDFVNINGNLVPYSEFRRVDGELG